MARSLAYGNLDVPVRAAIPPHRDGRPANPFESRSRPGLVALGLVLPLTMALSAAAAEPTGAQISPASLSIETASHEARQFIAWVIEKADNQGLPFLIVDKVNAQVIAFDRQGLLLGATPVLLGLARGDDAPAGIGERSLADISPEERITAAGRFVAARGENLKGKDVLWVDYDAALSLHAVISGAVTDHRLDRLATTTALDNRISYGCINVPEAFFETVVRPLFTTTISIVYILPETRSIEDEFFTRPSAGPLACGPGAICPGNAG